MDGFQIRNLQTSQVVEHFHGRAFAVSFRQFEDYSPFGMVYFQGLC